MGRLHNLSTGLKVAGALAVLAPIKYAIVEHYLKKRRERQAQLASNRHQFGSLPRVRQRAVLYYRRQQLADLQNIYQKGYAPRVPGAPRRRKLF